MKLESASRKPERTSSSLVIAYRMLSAELNWTLVNGKYYIWSMWIDPHTLFNMRVIRTYVHPVFCPGAVSIC